MAYERRDIVGGAARTTLSGDITSTSTTITVADGTNWPTGANGKFLIVIDRATSSEEKILALSRSGNTITVASASDRGADGTTGRAHTSGAYVEHVIGKVDADEANYTVNETVGKITTAGDLLVADGANSLKRLGIGTARQHLRTNAGATDLEWAASPESLLTAKGDLLSASAANTPARQAVGSNGQILVAQSGEANGLDWMTPTVVFYTAHTWAISGEIKVPSGDTDFIIPMAVPEISGQVTELALVRYKINSGTSVTFKMQKGGVDVTGFTGLSATTTIATTDPTDVAITDLDQLVPVVTAVSGTPKNLQVTAVLKHTVSLTLAT